MDESHYVRLTINDRKIDLEFPEYISKFGKDAYNKITTTDGIEYKLL